MSKAATGNSRNWNALKYVVCPPPPKIRSWEPGWGSRVLYGACSHGASSCPTQDSWRPPVATFRPTQDGFMLRAETRTWVPTRGQTQPRNVLADVPTHRPQLCTFFCGSITITFPRKKSPSPRTYMEGERESRASPNGSGEGDLSDPAKHRSATRPGDASVRPVY